MQTCQQCKQEVELWNKQCSSCGFHLVLEPDEQLKSRYLRGPSLGAMFFTQGWALGARLYIWFLLSFVPIIGIVVLFILLIFGRRWSWKHGAWASWAEFQSRMRFLDWLAVLWLIILVGIYFWTR
ncbi:hypothetical protein HYV69_01155 [Candidatus Uhrbacteria bacterium]|nr:hypothetical protein [Candidatus Uhrbacteria bacterium]